MPVQPFKVPVTKTVPETEAAVLLLAAVNEAMLPLPLAAKPMLVLVLVQVKVPPAGVLVKVAAATVAPTHTETLAGTVTTGNGLTV